MLYITLHNLHDWGKGVMTKGGEISVAAELAKSSDSFVHVTGTSKPDFAQVQALYPDAKFKLENNNIVEDLAALTDKDVVLIPILSFGELSNPARRALVLSFYKALAKTKAVVAVMNICHTRYFYNDQIDGIDDEEIAALVQRILKKCVYIPHDPSMFLDAYNCEFSEQIVYFDRSKVKTLKQKNKGVTLSFFRPARFKGFNIWAEETKRRNDLVLVSNVMISSSLSKIAESLKKVEIIDDIKDYKPSDRPVIISQSYDIETPEFQALFEESKDFLVTTDYNHLAEQNHGHKPDYLIIENAMFDAVYNGLPLRWSDFSIKTMSKYAAIEATMLNAMTLEEQIDYLSDKFSADKTVEFLKGLA